MKPIKAKMELAALREAALEDLMATTDEQLRQEALEDGDDFDAIATHVAARLQETAAATLRDRLMHAKTRAQPIVRDAIQPTALPSLQKMKLLVQTAFQSNHSLGLAFRDGKKQSDADWQSLYEDLVELGEIRPSDDER